VAIELIERLESARLRTELDQGQLARLLGTNPRTVSRWRREQARPRHGARERLLEVLSVLELLSKTLRPQPAHDWLFTPNPLLGHHKPVDLLQEGKYRDVLGAIDALGEGVFV
jgi:putative toxin-antitoxin system antitoxin component (TIGR02293 family)